MTQAYGKVTEMKSIEVEEPQVPIQEKTEDEEILGDLNPKYFEESTSLKETRERSYASRIDAGSKFNFFSAF